MCPSQFKSYRVILYLQLLALPGEDGRRAAPLLIHGCMCEEVRSHRPGSKQNDAYYRGNRSDKNRELGLGHERQNLDIGT